jgi:hypothetical protein
MNFVFKQRLSTNDFLQNKVPPNLLGYKLARLKLLYIHTSNAKVTLKNTNANSVVHHTSLYIVVEVGG